MVIRQLLAALALIFVTTSVAKADSFTLERNGTTYLCESTGGGGGSANCWERCPWTFSSCAESCGGGNICWDKCPWTFSSCAESCGGGSRCWDKCPWTFSSCAESCGTRTVTREIREKFEATAFERSLEEQKHGINSSETDIH